MVARSFEVHHNDSILGVDYDTDDVLEVSLSLFLSVISFPPPLSLCNLQFIADFQIPALVSHFHSSGRAIDCWFNEEILISQSVFSSFGCTFYLL